ncbi:MAG: DUF1700 domain-containing protein [Eubacteriales bacterium]
MTREEYLATLKSALHSLPETDIADIARDFEEHFSVGLSQGKTEHEISAELGDPATVAGTYFDEGLEDIGHTMKESAAHYAAAAATASANRPGAAISGTSGTSGSTADAKAISPQKDLTGARLFVILLNVLITWWVAITVLSTLFSFWCVSVSLLIGGIGSFTALAAAPGDWISVFVLFGLAGILLSVATGILNYFLSKWTVIGSKAYINWNKKLYNEGF